MDPRARFRAIMNHAAFDRLPIWYFGTWQETRQRWLSEGLDPQRTVAEQTGMDPDWEEGMWSAHGLARTDPASVANAGVIEETADTVIRRTRIGAVIRQSKHGESIPQHVHEALQPTREDWQRFRKLYDPSDPWRAVPGLDDRIQAVNGRTHATCFLAGSLFACPRDWMGIEEWSCLAYTDPALYEEIVAHVCDYFLALNGVFLAKGAQFDFTYFFEDCCFKNGPLISPDIYRRFYHKYYRRMVDFYHAHGVDKVLLDSDGKVDALIPCWLESGIDIVFPIEVGTWQADPVSLRRQFGRDLRMMGGVNKHVIPRGERAIREHLTPLVPLVAEGGFIPLPDHRIPPDCSLEQFRTYVRVFREVFGAAAVP